MTPRDGSISTDILVIGAGPAGATVARRLAEAGRDVLLLDKAVFPRPKPCGGGIPPRAVRLLDDDVFTVAEGKISSVALDGAWLGRALFPTDGTLVVDRKVFDNYLVAKALVAGARFLPGRPFRKILGRPNGGYLVESSEGLRIETKWLCACDGVFSPTARALGYPKAPHGFCLEGQLLMPDGLRGPAGELAIFNMVVGNGYAWAFPRRQTKRYNIGIGVAAPHGPGLKPWLDKFLAKTPELRDGVLDGPLRGGMIPDFNHELPDRARDGAFLLGDAATLADPLTGEGIGAAIMSGEFAAKALLGDHPEERYNQLLEAEILCQLRIARRAALRFRACKPWQVALMLSLPPARKKAAMFADMLSGRLDYRELYRRTHGGRDFRG